MRRRKTHFRTRRRVFLKKAGQGALWVWKAPGEVEPAALISGARAVGARTLYLNFYPLTGPALDWLEAALAAARESGLRLELLCGAPGWIKESSRPFLTASIVEPLQRLKERLQTGGIDRPLPLHLDVEPHIEAPLDERRMAAYLDLLLWLRGQLSPAEISIDVPVWYSALKLGGRPFSECLLEQVESVTLMAYEQSIRSVVSGSSAWVEAASRSGRQVTVGLEVGNQGPVRLDTPHRVSRAIKAVARGLKRLPGFPAFQGVAVHRLEPF